MNTIYGSFIILRIIDRCHEWIFRGDCYYIFTCSNRRIIINWLLFSTLSNRNLLFWILSLKIILKTNLFNSKTFFEIILTFNTLMMKKRSLTFFAIKWILWPWSTMFDFLYICYAINIIILYFCCTTLPG